MNALTPGRIATLRLDGDPLALPASGLSLRRTIAAGRHRLEVSGAGGELVGTHEFTVSAGLQRAVVLGQGRDANVALLGSTSDTASMAVPGAAKVRLVHAVEGIEATTGYLRALVPAVPDATNGRVVSPFVFGVGSDAMFPGYVVRSPGSFRAAAIALGTPERILAEGDFVLAAGEVASLVLVRLPDGTLGWRLVMESSPRAVKE
jgi:hypothetical protein